MLTYLLIYNTAQYVRPDYKLHPALREESTPRPYKRKTVDPSSSADDDIRPNLAFQNYPFSSSSSSFPSSNFPSAPSKPAVVPYQRKLPTRGLLTLLIYVIIYLFFLQLSLIIFNYL